MTYEMIYKEEMKNFDTTPEVLTEAEKEELKKSYNEELKKDYENKIDILYFLAIDWNITISVIKSIIK